MILVKLKWHVAIHEPRMQRFGLNILQFKADPIKYEQKTVILTTYEKPYNVNFVELADLSIFLTVFICKDIWDNS